MAVASLEEKHHKILQTGWRFYAVEKKKSTGGSDVANKLVLINSSLNLVLNIKAKVVKSCASNCISLAVHNVVLFVTLLCV